MGRVIVEKAWMNEFEGSIGFNLSPKINLTR